MHTKVSGPSLDEEDTNYWHHGIGGTNPDPFIYASEHRVGSWNYKVTRGENTPNYHKRLKRGELLPLTAFEQMEWSGSSNGSFDLWRSDGAHWYAVGRRAAVQLSEFTEGNLYDKLTWCREYTEGNFDYDPYVQAAAAKIYSTGWDTLTFIAEFKKTKEMFERISSSLWKSWKRKTWPKDFDKEWLQARYGLRTLVYDIEDLIGALNSLDDARERFKERAGFSHSYQERNLHVNSDPWYGVIETQTITDYEVSVRGNVVADIQPPKFGFNPITTGWELVRFSFIIDWFIQVGKALEAGSFLLLASKYYAAGGYHMKQKVDTRRECVAPDSQMTSVIDTVNTVQELTYTRRHPTKIPLTPQLNVRLDIDKIRDLVALLGQAVR
jgi:hypothetical protein